MGLLTDATAAGTAPTAVAVFIGKVSEARNSVSAGYKRSRAVGAFFYSDSYWGYEWSEDEGGQKGEDQDEEDEEELGEGAGKVQQQLELVAQREHRAVRLKRQHRPAGMAT